MIQKLEQSNNTAWDFRIIYLTRGLTAIVDAEDYEELNKYFWHTKKSFSRWYAARKVVKDGKEYWIKMHRQIMNTPPGLIVHHVNKHTTDNRKKNLQNMTQKNHHWLHVSMWPRLVLRKEKILDKPNEVCVTSNPGQPKNSKMDLNLE